MNLRILTAAALAATALAGSAGATVLTFDVDTGQPFSNLIVPQTYGDNVTALTQGFAGYGVGAEGFTPNVTVRYFGGAEGASLAKWDANFGDLNNVLYNDDDGDTLLGIQFTADAGHTVTLFGFDLGGWNRSDYTIPNLTVTSGLLPIYSMDDVHVEGTAGHSTFSFGAAGLSGQTLSILIDLTGLEFNSDNIGIDNIRFGQDGGRVPGLDQPLPGGVPEPATWAMMIAGFGLAGSAIRRRRALAAA